MKSIQQKLLYLFTRTPLHVGANGGDGLIDRPIQRERHTGFPIIPGSTLKGVFASGWAVPAGAAQDSPRRQGEALWLFGSDDPANGAPGALQFSEARLLAFPVRSAKASFAWVTCPLILRRWTRDHAEESALDDPLGTLALRDDQAVFDSSVVAWGDRVVLEEYALTRARESAMPDNIVEEFKNVMPKDPVWSEVSARLIIISDGLMSFFARSACDVTQHAPINDAQGTAAPGGVFNQENVPSETMFYSCISWFEDRHRNRPADQAQSALEVFGANLRKHQVCQLGGDASTGLGYCTVELPDSPNR